MVMDVMEIPHALRGMVQLLLMEYDFAKDEPVRDPAGLALLWAADYLMEERGEDNVREGTRGGEGDC